MPTTPAAETATIRTRILPEIHRAATEGTTRPDWDLPRCPSEADAVAEAAKVTSGAAEAVSTETDSRLEAGRPHSEATTVVLRPWTAILIATAGLVQETATAVRKTGRWKSGRETIGRDTSGLRWIDKFVSKLLKNKKRYLINILIKKQNSENSQNTQVNEIRLIMQTIFEENL